MTKGVIKAFKDGGLYWQPPEAVASIIVGALSDRGMVGKAFYIEFVLILNLCLSLSNY